MRLKDYLLEGLLVFAVSFWVAAAVTYLWNLLDHGAGATNWLTAFALALELAGVVPLARTAWRRGKHGRREG